MTIMFKQADGKDLNSGVFALLAGRAGIGKTTQLTTFPVAETLGISVEKGFLSIEGSGVRYAEVQTYDDILTILEAITVGDKNYKWVKNLFIDSLSEIYDFISKEAKDKYTAKQNFAKFDEIVEKLLHVVRVGKNLTNLNVIFTCHTQERMVGLAKEEDLAFNGQIPEKLKRQFDLIVNMRESEDANGHKIRSFVTSPEISACAKKRVSPFMKVEIADVEEANLYKLCNKLLGKGA